MMIKNLRDTIFIFLLFAPATGLSGLPLETVFESSKGNKTPTFTETLAWFEELDEASEFMQLNTFGISPQGRPLLVLVADSHKRFKPEEHGHRQDEVVW